MLTGLFRDRARLQRESGLTSHQALARLMTSKTLAVHQPIHRSEIGPFVVDYVFRRRSLVVELTPRERSALERLPARVALLNELGYSVLHVCRRELREHPHRVLLQIAAALR